MVFRRIVFIFLKIQEAPIIWDLKVTLKSLVNNESYGKNSLKYLGLIIWNSIQARLRNIETLTESKKEICKWKIDECPCRLCESYIGNVGFL